MSYLRITFGLLNIRNMALKDSITRINAIIHKLRNGSATLKQIGTYLSLQEELLDYKLVTSPRTFKRDCEDILSLYGIEIEYDFSKKKYAIVQNGQPEANNRMLEAFDISNALKLADGFSKMIHFEKRRPQGTQNLNGLLHAIQHKVFIKFDYQKYWIDEQTERTVAPYALKEFKNRWYVIAKDSKDKQIKSFGLDRLSNLDITKKEYPKQESFDIDAHYKNSFGIISPNEIQPEQIILCFNAFQGKYVKSLPLHDSQMVIIDNTNEVQIQLYLCITHDFVMELLSFGNDLKVLQPQTLVDKIKTAHYNAYKKY